MTKQTFIDELRSRLSGLPENDLAERLGFYGEMIDDRIEEGFSEQEAVESIGSVDEVCAQILADYPLSAIVKEKVRPKRSLRAWEIVLIILGSPVWLPLLIAAFAVLLSLYISVWSVIISLWAVFLSLAISALCGIVAAGFFIIKANAPASAAMFGAGLLCAGLSILMFLGCKAASAGIVKLTRKSFIGIKTALAGRRKDK